jgi:hypothetical protein
MTIAIDEQYANANGRIAHISLALMTLRFVSAWRRSVADVLGRVPDHETSLVIGAMLCISSEKLIRSELPSDLRALERQMPSELLTKCNVTLLGSYPCLHPERPT